MRRTFEVRRETSEQPDGQDRWDRAYQLVLRWAAPAGAEQEGRPMRVALYVRVSTDRQQQARPSSSRSPSSKATWRRTRGGRLPPRTSSATTATAAPGWTVPALTRCATRRREQ